MSYELMGPKDVLAQEVTDTTVIMPIGGQATRAREVTQDVIPKHLIRLDNGKTVLDTITHGLQVAGFKKFVFCLGHHSDKLYDHLESGGWQDTGETSHQFSIETVPLGPDGAIVKAIGDLGIKGTALVIPGDLMLPWEKVRDMNIEHQRQGADITVGVTSYITPRTTDVRKIIGESETGRLLWCYPRTAPMPPILEGANNLTSAAATMISIDRYQRLCETYLSESGGVQQPLSFRDIIMPWVVETHPNFDVRVFDIKGEILDLGTPDNIHYGQANWAQFV